MTSARYAFLVERSRADMKEFHELKNTLLIQRRELVESLEALDIASRGNYGWEQRIAFALGELCALGMGRGKHETKQ